MTGPDIRHELRRLRIEADYMRFLVAAGELLSSSLDYRTTLANVCAAAVDTIADICILDIGTISDVEPLGAAHRNPDLTPQLAQAASHLESDAGRAAHPVCRVLSTGKTAFVPVVDDAWIERNASNPAHAAFMRAMGYRSLIVVPVKSLVWGVTGALTLVRTDPEALPYDENAVAFAEDLGRRCGIAIGKARLHSQTVDVARRFQQAALPDSLPDVRGLAFDAYYEPADAALLVGGDWYDAFMLKNGDIGVSVGDVSGHGLEAAALMSCIRNATRMALVMETDLAKVLYDADFLFRNEAPEHSFCTTFVARVDPRTGHVTCGSAGHPSPLVWDGHAVRAPFICAAPPLGYIASLDATVVTTEFRLEPGSTAVFYTDGLIESTRNVLHGEQALREALRDPAVRSSHRPARAIARACLGSAHADDIAILTMRYDGT